MTYPRFFAAAALLAAALPAQTTVDYPDSTLSNPPELFFPFYTIGSGATVRYQTMMPGDFAGLPTTPQIVSRIGFSIAGEVPYSEFVVRAGVGTDPTALSSFTWADNLADQRVQFDLSGDVLPGGVDPVTGEPVNEWVEFELDAPFVWQPGQSIVVDITSASAVAPTFSQTSVHQTGQRVYRFFYTDEPSANLMSSSDVIKFRAVFEPLDPTGSFHYGEACVNATSPQLIGASGSSQIGNVLLIDTFGGNGANPGILFFGVSRRESLQLGDLPAPFFGCELLTSWDHDVPATPFAPFVLPLPFDPALVGVVLYTQWAQLDGTSPGLLPFGFSDGLGIVLQ